MMAAMQPHPGMHPGSANASMAAASLAASGLWKMADDGAAAGVPGIGDVAAESDHGSGASAQGGAGQLPLQASTIALLQYQAAWQQLLAVHQVQQAAAASATLAHNTQPSDASCSDSESYLAAVKQWQAKHLPAGSITPLQQLLSAVATSSRGAQQQQPVQALTVFPSMTRQQQQQQQHTGNPFTAEKNVSTAITPPSEAASKRSMSVAASAVASTGSNGQLELVFPRRGRKSGEVDCKVKISLNMTQSGRATRPDRFSD